MDLHFENECKIPAQKSQKMMKAILFRLNNCDPKI